MYIFVTFAKNLLNSSLLTTIIYNQIRRVYFTYQIESKFGLERSFCQEIRSKISLNKHGDHSSNQKFFPPKDFGHVIWEGTMDSEGCLG